MTAPKSKLPGFLNLRSGIGAGKWTAPGEVADENALAQLFTPGKQS